MTTTQPARTDSPARIERAARRAWFAAGVRRGDRRQLLAELRQELAAAEQDHALDAVLGNDPSSAARDWAEERGLTGRRLRLLPITLASVVAGLLGGGGVLAILVQAFANGGNTVLSELSIEALVGTYVLGGVAAYAAILLGAGVTLQLLNERHVRATVTTLARMLPSGALAATVAGTAIAAELNYEVRPRTFSCVFAAVLLILIATLAAARLMAVRKQTPTRTQLTSLRGSGP